MRLLWLLLAWLAFWDVSASSKCGPKLDNGGSVKRSVGFLRLERNVTRIATTTALAKRMELPGDLLGVFYKDEFPKLSKKIVRITEAPLATDLSAAIMLDYFRVKKEWSTGIEGLMGCTALYVISRKGVYGAHWWENISFDPDKIWLSQGSPDELFETTVTDMLRYGGKHHKKLDPKRIDDDHIKAYLIRPRKVHRQKTNSNEPDYSKQWAQIRTTLVDLLPKLKDTERLNNIIYDVVDDESELDKSDTVSGRSLFKYDKAHEIVRGQTQKRAMLWVEGDLVYEDAW